MRKPISRSTILRHDPSVLHEVELSRCSVTRTMALCRPFEFATTLMKRSPWRYLWPIDFVACRLSKADWSELVAAAPLNEPEPLLCSTI